MKKILKRNQVIIAALAIMIVVAGYLNLSGDPIEETVNGGKNGKTTVTPVAGLSEGTGDIFTVADDGEFPSLETDQSDNPSATPTGEAGETDTEETAATEGDAASVDGEEVASADGEENAAADGEEVASANGTQEDTPGTAVLASTRLSADFFTGAKLSREQVRSQNKETLMSIVNDQSISEDLKKDAISALVAMTENAEMEDVTESLLEAKGFDDVVVHIEEESVDVILNAASLTEAQTAQIEDIVMRKTGAGVEDIVITHAVMED